MVTVTFRTGVSSIVQWLSLTQDYEIDRRFFIGGRVGSWPVWVEDKGIIKDEIKVKRTCVF